MRHFRMPIDVGDDARMCTQWINQCGITRTPCDHLNQLTCLCSNSNSRTSATSIVQYIIFTTLQMVLTAIAQYSWDCWQMAHSAADISCFELRWNFRNKLSSSTWSRFCSARWLLIEDEHEKNEQHFGGKRMGTPSAYLPANNTHWPDQSTDIAVACKSRCIRSQAVSRVTHGGSRLLNASVNDDMFPLFSLFTPQNPNKSHRLNHLNTICLLYFFVNSERYEMWKEQTVEVSVFEMYSITLHGIFARIWLTR